MKDSGSLSLIFFFFFFLTIVAVGDGGRKWWQSVAVTEDGPLTTIGQKNMSLYNTKGSYI
jgi:hypothetical protein